MLNAIEDQLTILAYTLRGKELLATSSSRNGIFNSDAIFKKPTKTKIQLNYVIIDKEKGIKHKEQMRIDLQHHTPFPAPCAGQSWPENWASENQKPKPNYIQKPKIYDQLSAKYTLLKYNKPDPAKFSWALGWYTVQCSEEY